MSELSTEKSLLYTLQLKEKEITQLKKVIEELRTKTEYYENEEEYLKMKIRKALNDEKLIKNLTEENEQLEKEKRNLMEELRLKEKHNIDTKEQNIRKTEELYQKLKLHVESLNVRLEAASHLENLSFAQQNKIASLQKEIMEREVHFQGLIESKIIEFDEKIGEKNRNIMDQIRNIKKADDKIKHSHLGLAATLTNLLNQQLASELEYQSTLIEDLIEQKAKSEKMNLQLRADLQIMQGMNNVLREKTRRLKHVVDDLMSKRKEEDQCSEMGIENLETASSQASNKMLRTVSRNKTVESFSKALSNTKSKLMKGPIDGIMRLEKRIKQLEFELENKKSEYEIIKMNYGILTEKTTNLEKKYSNIYQMFDEALQNLSEDKTLKNASLYHLNIDDIRNAEFSHLKPEQKYSVLCILSNLLLPIVKKDYQEKKDLAKSNSVIKFKYSFKKEEMLPRQKSSTKITQNRYNFNFPSVTGKTKEKLASSGKRFDFAKMSIF